VSTYRVNSLEAIDEVTDGRSPWRPVRLHFGITSFGVNAWTGRQAGDQIINEHAEEGEDEELYFVHSGRARFELGGDTVEAPAGSFVFVPPGMMRSAFAQEPDTTIVAMGGTPGKAYEPTGWEYWAPVARLYNEGRYEEAADAGRTLALEHPEYPELLYNVACCASLAGRQAEAIEHLSRAIEHSERVREYARQDTDFDAIRDTPDFKALLG
jgi:mannose-6-phosphate isomerase-like protein (cupin superfamily)